MSARGWLISVEWVSGFMNDCVCVGVRAVVGFSKGSLESLVCWSWFNICTETSVTLMCVSCNLFTYSRDVVWVIVLWSYIGGLHCLCGGQVWTSEPQGNHMPVDHIDWHVVKLLDKYCAVPPPCVKKTDHIHWGINIWLSGVSWGIQCQKVNSSYFGPCGLRVSIFGSFWHNSGWDLGSL